MLVYLLIAVAVAAVAALLWRQRATRLREEQAREERRARTDKLLAKVLLGEEAEAAKKAGARTSLAKPVAAPIERMARPVDGAQQIDVDLLLGDEPTSVADQARQQLAQPTDFLPSLGGASGGDRPTTSAPSSPLSLQDGQIDVALDALVIAWFEARGYVARPAAEGARPLQLLLTHRDDRERSYAFYFERGRLNAQRAAALLEQARALGMNKLLVAAEHGADPAVSSSRLRDVQVMDWVALDREMKKLDFRVAAKIIAIARAFRGSSARS